MIKKDIKGFFPCIFACIIALLLLLSSTPVLGAYLWVPEHYIKIQDAIDAASDGDTIILHATGTRQFKGRGNKGLIFYGKKITLKSYQGAAKCIINCENDGVGMKFIHGEGADTVIDGITIQNSNTGAIYMEDASPTITNCVIKNNTANRSGAGIGCYQNSAPTISNCEIKFNDSNGSGGGIYFESASPTQSHVSPTVSNCNISYNFSQGGGGGIFSGEYANPTISDCTIKDNVSFGHGGGVYSAGNALIERCDISENHTKFNDHADGGGIYLYKYRTIIRNCVISRNTAMDEGGAIYFYWSNGIVQNCTVFRNTASNGDATTTRGGAFSIFNEYPELIVNSIIWENSAPQIIKQFEDPVDNPIDVHYCNVDGGFDGYANIVTPPMFVSEYDFHLQSTSGCINAGNNNINDPNMPTVDKDGNQRIANGTVDMGAYEYGSSP
ncbi:MAG: hypothetical protein GY859_35980 [Desulfobacterales bacterium]|nr:hypothetical protein [Desulfobacterales bacterium]